MKKHLRHRFIAEHFDEENVFIEIGMEHFPSFEQSDEFGEPKFEQEERVRNTQTQLKL